MSTATASLRHHPELVSLFKEAESRHLNADEMALYRKAAPEHEARASAAEAVKACEAKVVREVVQRIFASYPYEEHHEFATAKCTRDIRYVSAYATLTMLMGDPQWFDDKLLVWLKTILQAFEFPDKARKRRLLLDDDGDNADEVPAKIKSIRDTYTRLRDGYEAALSPEAFAEMRPYLQQAIDVLSGE